MYVKFALAEVLPQFWHCAWGLQQNEVAAVTSIYLHFFNSQNNLSFFFTNPHGICGVKGAKAVWFKNLTDQ